MTYPDDVTDSARRRMVRRNSLGSQRTVTFSKPSPERNSVCSIRSIKEYTTTQSFKELSIDSSQAEDEVTSKAMITKTASILRTPRSIPAKTFTSRNRFETPKSSYTRTSRTEVYSHLARSMLLMLLTILISCSPFVCELPLSSIITCTSSLHTTLMLTRVPFCPVGFWLGSYLFIFFSNTISY
jgi:NIMA (never in mitosis gene a)-related kinase